METKAQTEQTTGSYLFKGVHFDFIGKRNIAFIVSIVLIVLGMGSLLIKGGPNLGIDFVGGVLIELRFENVVPIERIRQALGTAQLGKSIIQEFGDEKEILIRLERGENISEKTNQINQEVVKALRKELPGEKFEVRREEIVGPQVGSELTRQAQLALLFAIAGIVLYISWRFEEKIAIPVALIGVGTMMLSTLEIISIPLLISVALLAVLITCIWFDLRFAFAAVIALLHDVTITVGIFFHHQ